MTDNILVILSNIDDLLPNGTLRNTIISLCMVPVLATALPSWKKTSPETPEMISIDRAVAYATHFSRTTPHLQIEEEGGGDWNALEVLKLR